MGSADHHSVLVADGEDERKYVGREDGTNDIDGLFDEDGLMEIEGFDDGSLEIEGFDDGVDDHDEDGSLEIEGFDDGVDDHDEVKGSQMGLSSSLTDPVGWTLK